MGISQEDIDNLDKDSSPQAAAEDTVRDEAEVAARGKIFEAFASHVSNIFATLTGGDVKAGFQSDDIIVGTEIGGAIPGDWFGYVAHLDLEGNIPTVHLITKPVAAVIAGKIMGQDPPEALEDAHIGALKEAAANLAGAWATGLGETLGADVKSTREPEILEDVIGTIGNIDDISSGKAHVAKFSLSIGDAKGEYILIFPGARMKDLVMAHPEYVAGAGAPDAAAGDGPQAGGVSVDKAVFQEFEVSTRMGESAQIDLLLDVELTVSVELGRKRLSIKEILDMVPGSLLELEKLAGEPVDLMVNGKLFAYGEVVVIDENFGVRITSIVSPQERLEKLK